MKKILAAIALALLISTPALAGTVTATWTHDGLNTTGYALYWYATAQGPVTEYCKTVSGNTVRTLVLDEAYFAPGVPYTFSMVAYRDVAGEENDAMSGRSETVQWTRPGDPFVAPVDHLPSTLYLVPNNISQIVISIP